MRVFKEEQRFTQWWLWAILLSINLFFVYVMFKQLWLKTPFGDNPMPNTVLIIFTLFFTALTLFFCVLKLQTIINNKGVHYRFYPIQKNYRVKNWDDIKTADVVKYNPILDYGGWGIKHNSYTVKNNIGIQLVLKNNKKLLIGTQKKEDVKKTIKNYKNKTH